MRLTHGQIDTIRRETAKCFCEKAEVWLFGSRVDDQAKGGDVDLYIEVTTDTDKVFRRSLKLEGALQIAFGLQRIDIITHVAGEPLAPIHQEARNTWIVL